MPETEKKVRAVLVLVKGRSHCAKAIKLRLDSTILGREKGDALVEDKEISASHCQIQRIDNQYYIFDMNSTNGTFVNGTRVTKTALKEGDLIGLGQISYKFTLKDESKVRHMTTVLKSPRRSASESSVNLVDTLVESDRLTSGKGFMLRIEVIYEDKRSEHFEFRQKELYLGRASSFGRFDNDPELSRKHLFIKVNDSGEVFIEDQGSTNGSYLNGSRITGLHLIRSTDEIRIGSNSLRIRAFVK